MRGGHMNGKYPSRGGSSFRGSSGPSSYGYYDPYYSSSPVRGGRGGFRGRGGNSSGGHYGAPNGYSAAYPDYGNGTPHNNGSNNNIHSGMTPTSSAASAEHGPDSSIGNISHGNIGSGYNDSRMLPSSAGNNSSGEMHGCEGWDSGYGDYNGGHGRGGISPRFRGGRGRGRGAPRGAWRGNRGGSNAPYYGRGRNGYEYESYNAALPATAGQYYYGREYGVDPGVGGGEVEAAENNGANGGYDYSHRVSNTSVDESYGHNTTAREEEEAAAKAAAEKAKAEELKQKQEREHKMNAEFKEKHWIERIHATGDAKKSISRCFDELDLVNNRLLDIGTRRIEIEIAVNRYNRALKAEEERARIAEEKLESMDLAIE